MHDFGKQVHRAGIVVLIGELRRLAHVLDHDEQVSVRFLDHLAHRLARLCGLDARGLLELLQLHGIQILADHPDTLGKVVDRAERMFGEFVKHQMQVTKKRAERLPVLVFVVGIQDESVGYLTLKMLHHRVVLAVFL